MKKFLILNFFCINILNASYLDYIYENREPSYNSFGVAGLIQTPSAEIFGEANLHFVLTKNDIYKLGTLTIAPFDWLEASYFYYRPSDLLWAGPESKGLYLDKGFNVKVNYQPKFKYAPKIAIGMNDFAGHSLFSREYIVATQELRNFKFNLGMGWGAFSQQKDIKTHLKFLVRGLVKEEIYIQIITVLEVTFLQIYGLQDQLEYLEGLKLVFQNPKD